MTTIYHKYIDQFLKKLLKFSKSGYYSTGGYVASFLDAKQWTDTWYLIFQGLPSFSEQKILTIRKALFESIEHQITDQQFCTKIETYCGQEHLVSNGVSVEMLLCSLAKRSYEIFSQLDLLDEAYQLAASDAKLVALKYIAEYVIEKPAYVESMQNTQTLYGMLRSSTWSDNLSHQKDSVVFNLRAQLKDQPSAEKIKDYQKLLQQVKSVKNIVTFGITQDEAIRQEHGMQFSVPVLSLGLFSVSIPVSVEVKKASLTCKLEAALKEILIIENAAQQLLLRQGQLLQQTEAHHQLTDAPLTTFRYSPDMVQSNSVTHQNGSIQERTSTDMEFDHVYSKKPAQNNDTYDDVDKPLSASDESSSESDDEELVIVIDQETTTEKKKRNKK